MMMPSTLLRSKLTTFWACRLASPVLGCFISKNLRYANTARTRTERIKVVLQFIPEQRGARSLRRYRKCQTTAALGRRGRCYGDASATFRVLDAPLPPNHRPDHGRDQGHENQNNPPQTSQRILVKTERKRL